MQVVLFLNTLCGADLSFLGHFLSSPLLLWIRPILARDVCEDEPYDNRAVVSCIEYRDRLLDLIHELWTAS